VTPKTGEVVGVRYVTPDEGLMIITQEGMIIRLNVSGVREVGRSAQGVKLMNLDAEDCIVAVAKLAEKDEETEIELAKDDGGLMPAELELEAADTDEADESDGLAILDETDFEEGGDDEDDEGDGGPDETVH
jgi:DNA gyrase subunit A